MVFSKLQVMRYSLSNFLLFGAAFPLLAAHADVVPTAFVSEAGRAIVVSGERVELDAASCFDAWADGVKPGETDREAAYAQWGAYAVWNADFVVSFDRAVAAGSVSLYGQTVAFGEEWLPLPVEKPLAANVPFRILEDGFGVSVPYAFIAEEVVRFVCGVKNFSSANIGTTMTIELRLSDPNGLGDPVVLAKRACTFRAARKPGWFDARIADYRRWPDDAALAERGEWRMDAGTLGEAAAVDTPGVLSVDAESALKFVAQRPRQLDELSGRLCVSCDADFSPFDSDALPAIDPNWKGGVIRVKESGGEAYYGLARDGVSNAWTRLEGPVPTDGPVRFEMCVQNRTGRPSATYTINGADCLLNGRREIPVVAAGAVSAVSLVGTGTLSSLKGAVESGMSVIVR